MKKGPRIDISGKVYGKLTVLRPHSQTKRGMWKWECRCECGNLHAVPKGHLDSGACKSCGCIKKGPQILRGFRSPDGLIRQLLGHYRQGANRRNLSFSLTFDEFKSLIFKNCHYCGQIPNQSYRPTRYVSDIRYNGIDRIENAVGYEIENCVPCCKVCNQAKSSLTLEEFLNFITRVYYLHCLKEEKSK